MDNFPARFGWRDAAIFPPDVFNVYSHDGPPGQVKVWNSLTSAFELHDAKWWDGRKFYRKPARYWDATAMAWKVYVPPLVAVRTYLGSTSVALGGASPNQTDRAWFTRYTVPPGGMNIDGVRYRSNSGASGGATFKGAVHLDYGTGIRLGTRLFLGTATSAPAPSSVSDVSSGTNVFVAGGTVIWVGMTFNDPSGNSTLDTGGTGVTILLNGNYSYSSPPGTPPLTSGDYTVTASIEATGIN